MSAQKIPTVRADVARSLIQQRDNASATFRTTITTMKARNSARAVRTLTTSVAMGARAFKNAAIFSTTS